MDVDARLEALTQENETLRERIAQLEEALRGKQPPPVELRLTASEAIVFGLLLARTMVSKQTIMTELYYSVGKDEAEAKIADVYICKIRAKLKPFNISIVTHWGQGWEMPEASKAIVRGMMPVKLDVAA